MLEIRAKVGTGPMTIIYIGWKRKPPIVGDRIKFRSFPYQKREKWSTGIVDMIRDVGYPLYYIARF